MILRVICRSEDMKLYQVLVQSDEAWSLIDSLGRLGYTHFVDLNENSGRSAYEMRYWKQIKAIEETLRKLE